MLKQFVVVLCLAGASSFAPRGAPATQQLSVGSAADDCGHEGIDAFAAIQFEVVKQSLATFLKFWLMGAPVRGWQAVGELKAVHELTGSTAELFVDVGTRRVGVIADDGGDLGKIVQLSVFSHELFDELKDIAATPEAEPADRLCYPPSAVEAARDALPLPKMADDSS